MQSYLPAAGHCRHNIYDDVYLLLPPTKKVLPRHRIEEAAVEKSQSMRRGTTS